MNNTRKSEWLVPAALVALSVVPVLAGTMRVVQLASGGPIGADNARFFAAPWPVLLHIAGATVFCLLGAFQFAAGWRHRHPDWHRIAGRVLLPCGWVSALSGLWMTLAYALPAHDGAVLKAIRLGVGVAMAAALGAAWRAIRRRDVPHHRAWMMRAYALGLGAGTQVLTHLPWFLLPDLRGQALRTLCMGAGWALNVAVVEWLLRRERRRGHP